MTQIKGTITQVIGPVVDVSFDVKEEHLPKIYEALEIKREDNSVLILECEQHIGEHTIRCIAMDSTDGLKRGMEVIATGHPISMPAGEIVKGRLMNVVGRPIDGLPEIKTDQSSPIHKPAPKYDTLSTETEIL